ncbi:hypothetical protein BS78_02G344300 [Paspalum vaginatum]|nr:hypothetical protein BS78_02G344300 [Paspalum vaginatum]
MLISESTRIPRSHLHDSLSTHLPGFSRRRVLDSCVPPWSSQDSGVTTHNTSTAGTHHCLSGRPWLSQGLRRRGSSYPAAAPPRRAPSASTSTAPATSSRVCGSSSRRRPRSSCPTSPRSSRRSPRRWTTSSRRTPAR